eukprot:c20379_g1_i1.p1 GENE.c20379_g1_i1~~c20379_g1_i1.p1  ORF type:complete len:616 (-),score=238.42 c20379_g1_i1:22-1869(-)
MGKFTDKMAQKVRPAWQGKYMDYKVLDTQLEVIANQPAKMHAQGDFHFKKATEQQLKTVNSFFEEKFAELENSLKSGSLKPETNTPEGWAALADKKAIELKHLEEYANLNYEGFQKILVKHDKIMEVKMLSAFMLDLDHNPTSFWKRCQQLRELVNLISGLYEKAGRYERFEPVNESTNKDVSYWIPQSNVFEVFVRMSAKLPIHDNNTNFTYIFLENDEMKTYAKRVLSTGDSVTGKVPGIVAERENDSFKNHVCAIERSEGFKKERCEINETDIDQVLKGKSVPIVNSNESSEKFLKEICNELTSQKLKPFTSSRYTRTFFKNSRDNKLEISVDSNIAFIKEFHIKDWNWGTHAGRVPDDNEISDFPFAVVRVRVRNYGIPKWIDDLVTEGLMKEVPHFSKFIHSCVLFASNKITAHPHWVEENPEFSFLSKQDEEEDYRAQEVEVEVGRTQPKPESSSNQQKQIQVQQQPTPTRGGSGGSGGFLSSLFSRSRVAPVIKGPPPKADPKAFLANERTYLNWNQQAITLGTFGIALFSVSNSSSPYAGLGLVFLAIIVLFYNQYQFRRRWRLLQNKAQPLQFLDPYGPFFLTTLLVLTFSTALVLDMDNVTSAEL